MGFLSLSGDRIAASKSRLINAGSAFTPRSITGLALWLDASDASSLYTTDAGAVTAVSSPTEIAGCVGWWDASDAASITQSGGSVSQINDKSGLAAHASQGTSGSRPTLIDNALNGRSILRFDGGDGLTGNFASSINTGAYSVFAVCKVTSMVTNGRVFSVAGASSDFASGMMIPCCTNASSVSQLSAYDGASGANKGAIDGFTSYAVFSGVVGSSSLTNASNGMRAASASVTLSAAVTRFGIGTPAQGGAGGWNGDIAEVIYYSAALSNADRARVEAYLAAKWGISGVHTQATATSDPVGAWLDKSGNARHATQSTAANRPVIHSATQNNRKILSFDGSNDALLGTGAQALKTGMTVIGAYFSGNVNYSSLFCVGEAAAGKRWLSGSSLSKVGIDYYTNALSVQADARNRTGITSFTLNPSANSLGIRMDGAQVLSQASLSPALAAYTSDTFAVGSVPLANEQWLAGRIFELAVYNRVLSAAECRRVEQALATKWGITLAPQVANADAQDWINRVYANGGTVSSSTAAAVNQFCVDIEAASLRDRFYRLSLMCGGTSGTTAGLAACLVPLYRGPSLGGTQYGGTTDTNVGPFVVGDYAETGASGGLNANGTSKYLATGLNPYDAGLAETDFHTSGYFRESQNASGVFIGCMNSSAQRGVIFHPAYQTAGMYVRFGGITNSGIENGTLSSRNGHLLGVRRPGGVGFKDGANINATSVTTGSLAWAASADSPSLFVFARNDTTATPALLHYAGRSQAYSIGKGMTDAQAAAYYTAMQAFQTALGRNV